MANKLSLKDAEAARQVVMTSDKVQIKALYEHWADQVAETAKKYEGMTTASAPMQAANLRQLEKEMRETAKQVQSEVLGVAQSSIHTVADAVVKSNVDWLTSLGFPEKGVAAALTSVPDQVVRRLVTGQVYGQGWSLSKAVWKDGEKTMRDVYQIVAAGRAQNLSAYETAKNLESYVRPDAAKQWNKTLTFKSKVPKPGFTYNAKTGFYEQVGRIYKKTVDYNAQRLVRTLAQHSYQQSLESVVRNNPFVVKFVWHAEGSRACPMCSDLDGLVFDKGKLPLDHPNGMCTFEPVVDKDIVDKLAKWVTAEDGTFPEIDKFAESFGFKPVPPMQAQQFLVQYGKSGVGSTAKTWKTWYDKLPEDAQKAASTLKMESGEGWATWYQKNVYTGEGYIGGAKGSTAAKKAEQAAKAQADFIAKHTKTGGGVGSESKTWTTWYKKLTEEEQKIATALKEESGEGWATWYSKNVYTGDGIIGGSKGSSAAKKAEQLKNMPSGTVTHEEFINAVTAKMGEPSASTSFMDFLDVILNDHGYQVKNDALMFFQSASMDAGKIMSDAWPDYISGKMKVLKLDDLLSSVYNLPKPSAQADAVAKAVSDAKGASKVTHESAMKTVNKISASTSYPTTGPLYAAVEKELGVDALAEFKTLLHEVKNAEGVTYHIDAWNLYKSAGNAKIDEFFVKHGAEVEKKAAEQAKKTQEAAKRAQAEAAKKNAALQDKIAKARQDAFEREKFVGGGELKTSPKVEAGPRWMEELKKGTEARGDAAESVAWDELRAKHGASKTREIERAVENYSGNDYSSICRAYRDADNMHVPLETVLKRGYEDDTKALTALRDVQTKEAQVLRRGTGPSEFTCWHNGDYKEGMTVIDDIFEGVLGSGYNTNWRETSISDATDAQLDQIADALNQAFSGAVGKNASPLSTSQIAGRGFGGDYHPIEMVYYAPEGTRGMSIMKTSIYDHSEGEFLLAHDQRLRFVKAERITDYKYESKNCYLRVYVEILT